jgi:glycosyltransferase involved in cell wall biosynthesis
MTRPGSLRIAHVNDIAFVAGTLAAAQRRRGDEAAVFETPKPGAARGPLAKWLLAPVRAAGLAWLATRLRLGRWDIVHVHYATHAMVGAWSGRPYVVHCHGSDVRGVERGSLRGRLLRRYLGRASLVLYATPDLREWVLPYRPDASFLPNPIDVDAFAPRDEPAADLLLGVRLDPIKGAETAIVAAKQLLAVRPETRVTVIEQGPLAGLARRALGDRARFVAPVPHAELPGILAAHRVALGQFRLGILSQLELEAMACGAQIVAGLDYPEALDDMPPIALASDADSALRALLGALAQPAETEAEARRHRRDWVVAHHGASIVAEDLARRYPRDGHAPRG